MWGGATPQRNPHTEGTQRRRCAASRVPIPSRGTAGRHPPPWGWRRFRSGATLPSKKACASAHSWWAARWEWTVPGRRGWCRPPRERCCKRAVPRTKHVGEREGLAHRLRGRTAKAERHAGRIIGGLPLGMTPVKLRPTLSHACRGWPGSDESISDTPVMAPLRSRGVQGASAGRRCRPGRPVRTRWHSDSARPWPSLNAL